MRRNDFRRGPTRVERHAARRRERAHEHLASVRARRNGARPPPIDVGRLLAVATAAVSIAAGAALGTPLGGRVAGWLAPAGLSEIHVRGAFRIDPEEIAAATGAARDVPISTRDVPQIAERVASHPWVSSARAAVLPGGILVIEIEEHVPEAVVVVENGRAAAPILLVDRGGTPFAPASASDVEVLPHLLPAGGITLGAPDARLAAALALAQRLPEHGLPGSAEIFIASEDDPEGLALRVPGLRARVVLGWTDLDARLEQLEVLLSAELAEVRAASRIDLRFEDQAVLRTHRSEGGGKAAAARGHAMSSNERSTG